MALTIPRGPLVSWGAFPFVAGRSLLQPGSLLATQSAHGGAFGQLTTFDRNGRVQIPFDYVATWLYHFRCDPFDNLGSLQTQTDALLAVYAASQVQTLTVHPFGSAGTVSASARLETIVEQATSPTYADWLLTFFIAGGLG